MICFERVGPGIGIKLFFLLVSERGPILLERLLGSIPSFFASVLGLCF